MNTIANSRRARSMLLMQLIAFSFMLGMTAFSQDQVRVFLQGGQSNADGRADPAGQPTYTDVLFYSDTEKRAGTLTALYPGASETSQFGPEIGFGRRITDLLGVNCVSNSAVAIIKYANGGTNLELQWKAGGDATTSGDGVEYTAFQATVTEGLAALAAAHTGAVITVEGMIWMQGESDVVNNYTASYFSNLTNFIADVRLTYGSELPFIVGRLSDAQTKLSAAGLAVVQAAQDAVAAADPLTGLVNTDAMSMKSDNLHFDADGQIAMGRGFAYEMAYLLWVKSQLTLAEIEAGGGAQDADPDGDLIVNIDEFMAGTDVSDKNSRFFMSIDPSGTHAFDISYPSYSGRMYLIDSCSNLTNNSWTTLRSTNCVSGMLTNNLTTTLPTSFFRARALLP